MGCFHASPTNQAGAEAGSLQPHSGAESSSKKPRREASSDVQGDFLAFTDAAEANGNGETYSELRKAIAELKEENSRWMTVCKQLKSGLVTTS